MSSDDVADGDPFRAYQAGDTRSFDVLFQRYQRPIFNYVYRMVGQLAVAEDLTQDVFLRLFSALGRTHDIANLRAWLYRIATNVAISYLRQRQHLTTNLEDGLERGTLEEPAGDVRDRPEERQLHREAIDEAARALRRLPDAHRQVLILRQLQGLPYHEIAVVMGLSVEAVTSLLHRARIDFRQQIRQIEAGGVIEKQKEEGRQ